MTQELKDDKGVEKELFIFEPHTPFSQSAIWQLQNQYYSQAGISAWSQGDIPFDITSNPATGKIYAELVFAFLRDTARLGNSDEAVVILELGAGHGKFCFHFLRHLESLIAQYPETLPPFCYVLSDMVQANLNFWKTHPRLQPFLDKGWLDFALVDATRVDDLELLHSGRCIKTGSLGQPMIVIANYFFDSIPQELFYLERKKLHRCLVSITLPQGTDDKNPSEVFKAAHLDYRHELLQESPYQETYLNAVLKNYLQTIDESYVLFPDTGLRCLHRLGEFSRQGVFLLTADKGHHREENVPLPIPPQLVTHGSFSFSVNYQAFKQYTGYFGGVSCFPHHVNYSLHAGCLFIIENAGRYYETSMAYQRFMSDFGPDELFYIKRVLSRSPEITFREIFSVVRMSAYDPRILFEMIPLFKIPFDKFTDNERWSIYQVVQQAWDNYYPIGESTDVAYAFGELLFLLGFFQEALTYLQFSVNLCGQSSQRLNLLALCHCSVGNYAVALSVIDEVLAEEPDNRKALELQKQLIENDFVEPRKATVKDVLDAG